MAIQSNLSLSAAAFPRSVLTYQDDDGLAVDLTGWSAVLVVRASGSSSEEQVTDAGILVNGGAAGTITVDWGDVDAELAAGLPEVGTWELHVVTPAGVGVELATGTLAVSSVPVAEG